MDVDARLAQIEKISLNARTTWFTLVALLVFVGVTLMGHKDSDFFAFGAETQLPLLNIAVPTEAFFIAAPVLAASLYIYLHIYLNDLWVALGDAPSSVGDEPLSMRIYPTMLGTSALILRRWLRREPVPPVKNRGLATIGISLLMTWVFGPVVLAVVWWRSWPYHDEWLALWIAFWFWLALVSGMGSFVHLWMHMRRPDWQPASFSWRSLLHGDRGEQSSAGRLSSQILGCVLLFAALGAFGWAKTEGGLVDYWPRDHRGELVGEPWFTSEGLFPIVALARVDLVEAELTRRPRDWLPYQFWREEWEKTFRDREGIELSVAIDDWTDEQREAFKEETASRWRARTRSLDTVSLRGRDLRNADLGHAFLTGSDLREANLDGSHLGRANLEGADLSFANLLGAELGSASLEGAELRAVKLERANLSDANLEGANLAASNLERAVLWNANLKGADLADANLKGANLADANLEGAILSGAFLEGARLRGVDLSSLGTALTQADIEPTFGGRETILPAGLLAPCHWDDQPFQPNMPDETYLAWRKGGAVPIPRNPDGSCPGD